MVNKEEEKEKFRGVSSSHSYLFIQRGREIIRKRKRKGTKKKKIERAACTGH